jgi:methyl-accepting chemotaxis protein
MNIKNLKIGTRLISAFLAVAGIAAAIGILGNYYIHKIDDKDRFLYEKCTVSLGQMADIAGSFNRLRLNTLRCAIAPDKESAKKAMARCAEQIQAINAALQGYSKILKDKEDEANYNKMKADFEAFDKANDKVLELKLAGKDKEALAYSEGELRNMASPLSDLMDKIIELNMKAAKEAADSNQKAGNAASLQILLFIATGVLVAVGLGFWISRGITVPITACVEVAQKVAQGETGMEIVKDREDETGKLLGAFKEMVNALKAMASDAATLSKAAADGELATRADASKHQGDFRRIVQGVNDTLDGVIDPINEVQRVMAAMEQGDLTARITASYKGDLQTLANAVNNSATRLAQSLTEISEAANTLASSSDKLSSTSTTMASTSEAMTQQANTAAAGTEQASANVRSMAAGVEQASANVKSMAAGVEQISANSNTVASASEEVNANLRTVGSAVEEMSTNMRTIAGATEQMTGSVNTVAAAIEEMSVSLNEVSRNSGQAATVAGKAAKAAGTTAETVDKLGKSAQEIGKVVDMIKGIAAQTNLLALNATIEAASAGEAGKGFAVVANEVKELAKQTAGATEEIRAQVEGMQANTQQAVKAIDEIVHIINEINSISGTIAAAVEEQTATTNEISKNVGHAARGASEVARNVQQSAVGANEVSKNVQEAVKGVSDITRNINQLAAGATDVARNAAEAAKGMNDVARNATEAAKGMNDVARNVGAVSTAAGETTRGAGDTNSAARELARLAEKLQSNIQMFKLDSRGGTSGPAGHSVHLNDAMQAHSADTRPSTSSGRTILPATNARGKSSR